MPTYIKNLCDNLIIVQAKIASGQSDSEVVPTGGMALVGVLMPAVWTPAQIALKAGISKDALVSVYSINGQIQKASADTSRFIPFPTDAVFAPLIQILSVDEDGAAVEQEGARVLTLVFRKYLS